MSTISLTTKLTLRVCPDCGGHFAIAQDYIDRCFELGNFRQTWACPYCKTARGFGEGKQQQLEKQIAAAEREKERLGQTIVAVRQQRENARAEAEHFRKSRDGMKGALRKLKIRVGRGVCPCCNRTFADLARHMSSKHPEVATGETP